jgi:hypothetical protein
LGRPPWICSREAYEVIEFQVWRQLADHQASLTDNIICSQFRSALLTLHGSYDRSLSAVWCCCNHHTFDVMSALELKGGKKLHLLVSVNVQRRGVEGKLTVAELIVMIGFMFSAMKYRKSEQQEPKNSAFHESYDMTGSA